MPDDTNQKPPPSQDDSGTNPPTLTSAGDAPPPPVPDTPVIPVVSEEQNTPISDVVTTPETTHMITTSSGGNKKRIVATVLGVLLLVGGVGAGILLVQRNQDVREQAQEAEVPSSGGLTCTRDSNTQITARNDTGAPISFVMQRFEGCPYPGIPNGSCQDQAYKVEYRPEGLNPGESETYNMNPASNCTVNQLDVDNCSDPPWQGGVAFAIDSNSNCNPPSNPPSQPPSIPPSVPPSPTLPPSPPPGTAQCTDTRAYKVNGDPTNYANWTLLGATQLSQLKAGEVVYFTLVGAESYSNGDFDKAKFTINGVARPETTNIKPQPGDIPTTIVEFYDAYTLPPGTASFSVSGQIHHTIAGWLGGGTSSE